MLSGSPAKQRIWQLQLLVIMMLIRMGKPL